MTKAIATNRAKGIRAAAGAHVEFEGREWTVLPTAVDMVGATAAVRSSVPVDKIVGDDGKAIAARRNRYEAVTNAVSHAVTVLLTKAPGFTIRTLADDRAGSRMASHIVGISDVEGWAMVATLRGPANLAGENGPIQYAGTNVFTVYRVTTNDEVLRVARLSLGDGPTCMVPDDAIGSLAAGIARDAITAAMSSAGTGKAIRTGDARDRVLGAARVVGSITG
jgi:hypothetical protein